MRVFFSRELFLRKHCLRQASCPPALSPSLHLSLPRTHHEAIIELRLLDEEDSTVREAVALQGRGRWRATGLLPIITLPCFSCFSASEKGRLVAVFRRFFALRWLRWSRV